MRNQLVLLFSRCTKIFKKKEKQLTDIKIYYKNPSMKTGLLIYFFVNVIIPLSQQSMNLL